MKTRARLDGDHWVLNGSKRGSPNAGVSTWYTVFASTEPAKGANGVSAFVVHAEDPGFEVGPKERKLGIKGSPTCEIYFSDCAIPVDRGDRRAGYRGSRPRCRTFDHTRPTIGRPGGGIAQGALDASLAYVKERKQFGRAISDFQGIQFMLADMARRWRRPGRWSYVAAAKADAARRT